MLAYAIIAAELLILYTVFWYVFLREPKPYRVKGDNWGRYDYDLDVPNLTPLAQGNSSSSAYTEHTCCPCAPQTASETPAPDDTASAPNTKKYFTTASKIVLKSDVNYGWVLSEPKKAKSEPAQFLYKLAQAIEGLSVKVP